MADEKGSIITETSSSGSVLAQHSYGPYGEPQNSSSSRFRYTGQILIPGTELYYYKARVYHPKLGRFMQTDPIGYEDGMNWYAYVGNDPINGVDPTGEFVNFAIGAGLGAVINGTAQLIVNGGDFSKIDLTQVAVAAAIGASGVGLGEVVASSVSQIGLTGGAAVVANIAGNTVGGAVIGLEGALANTAIDGLQGDSPGGLSLEQAGVAMKDGAMYSGIGAGFEAMTKTGLTASNLFGAADSLSEAGGHVASGVGSAFGNSADAVNTAIDVLKEKH